VVGVYGTAEKTENSLETEYLKKSSCLALKVKTLQFTPSSPKASAPLQWPLLLSMEAN